MNAQPLPGADTFRTAIERKFSIATAQGQAAITIRAGDLHTELGGYPGKNHRIPTCCEVMTTMMAEGDQLVAEPPRKKGASLEIRYRLPRESRTSPSQ